MSFKYLPLQHVRIIPLECNGRVTRCIQDASASNIYLVQYIMNGEPRSVEFWEDELETI